MLNSLRKKTPTSSQALNLVFSYLTLSFLANTKYVFYFIFLIAFELSSLIIKKQRCKLIQTSAPGLELVGCIFRNVRNGIESGIF